MESILDRSFDAVPGEAFVSRPVQVGPEVGLSYFIVVSNQPGVIYIDYRVPPTVLRFMRQQELGDTTLPAFAAAGSAPFPAERAAAAQLPRLRTRYVEEAQNESALPSELQWVTLAEETTSALGTIAQNAGQGTGVVVDIGGTARARWLPDTGTADSYVRILHGIAASG